MRKLISAVVALLAVIIAIPLLGSAAILGRDTACIPTAAPASTASAARSGPVTAVERWDNEQLGNISTILTVGKAEAIPRWGWVVATATAIQESTLRNLAGGADDSIGLFQQRPSRGWGTSQQLHDPEYQAGKFFDRLVTIDNWQQMPLTDAAQKVQQSAYPHAYAKHTAEATRLVSHAGSALGLGFPGDLEQCQDPCRSITAPASASGNPCLDATTVFARARSWLIAWAGGPVPYQSSAEPDTWFHGYRRDCSGYVSMALGLPGPGLNTIGLAQRSTLITKTDLQPGDLMINPDTDLRGHVVLFADWTDASMSRYYGYEQSGDGGTHYRAIPYPYYGTYTLMPYRWRN